MVQVYVKYNPYRLETTLRVNGRDVSTDSSLYKLTKGKRLQEWIGRFPKMLCEELNTADFSLEYCGAPLDWDDFEDAFEQAQREGTVKLSQLRYIAGKSDEDINEQIVKVFRDLKEGPIDDFREPKLIKAFENINNAVFSIHVIATMSSGKSTLINALIGKKLMPSKNEACTATITEILDADNPSFSAVVYDQDDKILNKLSTLTYEDMNEFNSDARVSRISVQGEIPFLDSKDTALMLVDTPGPNNAQEQAHHDMTYDAIENDFNNLFLYVLNGTQLGTEDDAALLRYVAAQIQKGGKQIRDRFLFVISKMDQFNPEEESIEKVILAAKRYLGSYGIEDPQLFPCSAFTALNIRTTLAGIDIDNLTRAQERELPIAARDTLSMIDKFLSYDSMHLEKCTTLSPSAQQELNFQLKQAIESGDTKTQALIHSGIRSIEAAIRAYVKKYAKTKKIKDLAETFQAVLEEREIFTKIKTSLADDEKMVKRCAEKIEAIRQKIDTGKKLKELNQKVANFNPLSSIYATTQHLTQDVTTKVSDIFETYRESPFGREEYRCLVKQFDIVGSDAITEASEELLRVIDREIVDTGEHLLEEYRQKLIAFDKTVAKEHFDIQIISDDFIPEIKKQIQNMKKQFLNFENINKITKNNQLDDINEITKNNQLFIKQLVDTLFILQKHLIIIPVLTAHIQLTAHIHQSLDKGFGKILDLVEKQVKEMKNQFFGNFCKIEPIMQTQHIEFTLCISEASKARKSLQKNRKTLRWLESSMNQIQTILDM